MLRFKRSASDIAATSELRGQLLGVLVSSNLFTGFLHRYPVFASRLEKLLCLLENSGALFFQVAYDRGSTFRRKFHGVLNQLWRQALDLLKRAI